MNRFFIYCCSLDGVALLGDRPDSFGGPEGVKQVHFGGLRMGSVYFEADVVLLASPGCGFQLSVERFHGQV